MSRLRDEDKDVIIWTAIAALVVAALAVFLIFASPPPPAGAVGSRVYVSPVFDPAVASRIEGRLTPGDGISVVVLAAGDSHHPAGGDVGITVYPEQFVLHASEVGWPGEVQLYTFLNQVTPVARDPIDRVIRLVDAIHGWQADHPKPIPPAPPAPPVDMSPFLWPLYGLGGIVGLSGVLYIIIKVQAHRRSKKLEALRRFEEFDPANPYGQFKPVDLGD